MGVVCHHAGMMTTQDHVLLCDLAVLTGRSESHLRLLVRSEGLGVKVKRGKREVWAVSRQTAEMLAQRFGGGGRVQGLGSLVSKWLADLRSGYHTGKSLTSKTIQAYSEGLDSYFRTLGAEKALENISAEGFRRCMSLIPVDDQARICHYSKRQKIYDALMSFYQLLIREGFKTELERLEIQKIRPRRLYPARQPQVSDEQFGQLLAANENLNGRNPFDREVMKLMLLLARYAGLRQAEILNLKTDSVDLVNGVLSVYGKGRKFRRVGIPGPLYEALEDWLNKWRPRAVQGGPHLVVRINGQPLTANAMQNRLEHLRDRAGVDITWHGLRGTFITRAGEEGMALPLLQMAVGHASIQTTMGYLKPSEQKMIEVMRSLTAPGVQQVMSAKVKMAETILEFLLEE